MSQPTGQQTPPAAPSGQQAPQQQQNAPGQQAPLMTPPPVTPPTMPGAPAQPGQMPGYLGAHGQWPLPAAAQFPGLTLPVGTPPAVAGVPPADPMQAIAALVQQYPQMFTQQAPPAQQQAPAPTQPAEGSTQQADDIAKLPQWAQKLITDARAGEAKYRVAARTEAAKSAINTLIQQHGWGVDPAALFAHAEFASKIEALNPKDPAFAYQAASVINALAMTAPWIVRAQPTGTAGQAPAPGVVPPAGQAPGLGQAAPIVAPWTGQAPVGAPQQAAPFAPPAGQAPAATAPSGAQFAAGSGAPQLITKESLAQMSPQQIEAALDAGQLSHLTG